jgi:sugar lactone lactonase YvrE
VSRASRCRLAGIVIFAAACAGDSAPRAWNGSIEMRADDVVVVNNPAEGIWTSATRWTLEEDLRIGGDDIDTDDFGAVFGITADSAGRIYVVLSRRSQVRAFDRDGKFLWTVGHLGRGPTDIQAPSWISFDSGGNGWIPDHMNARFSIVDTSGRIIGTRPRQLTTRCRCGMFLGDGRLIDGWLKPLAPSVLQTQIGVVDSSGRFTALVSLPMADSVPSTELKPAIPFAPRTHFALAPTGQVYTGINREYAISVIGLDGKLERIIRRAAVPIPVGDADREVFASDNADFAKQVGVPRAQTPVFPATKPYFGQMVVDAKGYLYVVVPEKEDGVAHGFDVFDPEGRFLGHTAGSVAFSINKFGGPSMDPAPISMVGDYIYATRQDDEGTLSVLRMRLVRP